mmetsp:Transcript_111095/g.313419  ORF Transcript_111095/g.313419 Transcript_111095/m.313419 type:complete len:248 (+) Transcript_111095:96-839(+)
MAMKQNRHQVSSVVLILLGAGYTAVEGFRLRRAGRGCAGAAASGGAGKLLPFDCYVENGAAYEGLQDMAASGRTCKNWLTVDPITYGSSILGIGNHNYCRNPSGSKAKPWCYTVDPNVEWEFCEVPACTNSSLAPTAWTAPAGSKSAGAEAAGPCTYTPPAKPGFEEYEAGRACMDHRGDTWWLITNKNTTSADPTACRAKCAELPGTEFFTFFAAATEGNCGCYRECILVDESLTVNSPTVYKMLY